MNRRWNSTACAINSSTRAVTTPGPVARPSQRGERKRAVEAPSRTHRPSDRKKLLEFKVYTFCLAAFPREAGESALHQGRHHFRRRLFAAGVLHRHVKQLLALQVVDGDVQVAVV